MQKIIWTILFVIMLTTMTEAADAVRPCKEIYASMPRRILNYMPALILNAKDKGRDVFREGVAAFIANKTDECTIAYSYYEQGEQNPPTCTETVSFCPVSTPPLIISTEESNPTQPIDWDFVRKKQIEEETQIKKEHDEEMRRNGLLKNWEDEEEPDEYLTVIIKYKEDGYKAAVLEDVKSVGGEMIRDEDNQWLPRVIDVKINRDKKQELIKKLKANPHIEYFYKSVPLEGHGITPNDPNYSYEGWAQKIGMQDAWGISVGGRAVKVAVLDTGITYWNDIGGGWEGNYFNNGNLSSGYNFVNNNYNTNDNDPNGHGTTVASVLASVGNNGIGLAGMSWYGSVMPVIVATPNGTGGTTCLPSVLALGINYAVANGAKIINISYSSTIDSPDVKAAVANAINAGVMVVASAGNAGMNVVSYPAYYTGVISVGGTDTSSATDQRWSGSNYGNWVSVAAPATQIAGYRNGNYYQSLTGTSWAAPQVAGLAALIRATNPFLSMNNIAAKIAATTSPVPYTGGLPTFKYGRIQPYNALSQALQGAYKDGDLDGDGAFNLSDTLLTLRTVVGLMPQTASAIRHGDLAPVFVTSTDFTDNPVRYIIPVGDGSLMSVTHWFR
jgi:thermitase